MRPPVKKAGKAAKKSRAGRDRSDGPRTPSPHLSGASRFKPLQHCLRPQVDAFARDGVVASLAGTAANQQPPPRDHWAAPPRPIGVGVEVIGVVTRTNRTNALLDLVRAGGAALGFGGDHEVRPRAHLRVELGSDGAVRGARPRPGGRGGGRRPPARHRRGRRGHRRRAADEPHDV